MSQNKNNKTDEQELYNEARDEMEAIRDGNYYTKTEVDV